MVNTTVWAAAYNVLRANNMTTIFGNPGSTEQPFLKNFPPDFNYILGVQEASVVGMADGFSQATMNPTLVVLHTAAGTGNGMGNIMTAFTNKSPLVIIAGQQAAEMVIGDPYLTNRDPTLLPMLWVKWAYEVTSPGQVPEAIIRAIATASQPPAGPVYLVVPLDFWSAQVDEEYDTRRFSTVVAPDPARVADFAGRISKAGKIALVYGEEVDISLAWSEGVALAELLQAPVYWAPLASRASFPFDHPLYRGSLALGQGPIAEQLASYDLVLAVGTEVFRYYPWAPGPVLANRTKLLQTTNSPHDAAAARVGDSILTDAKLFLQSVVPLIRNNTRPIAAASQMPTTSQAAASTSSAGLFSQPSASSNSSLMSSAEAFKAIAMGRKASDILFQESPSNVADLLTAWPIVEQFTYFSYASGGLGWALPASIGFALAQTNRTTFAVVGDGSLQYSIQSFWTAVQHRANVIILVPRNGEYAILKEFAVQEETPGCPGLDIPAISNTMIAEGYGMQTFRADTPADLFNTVEMARQVVGPVLIEFAISPAYGALPA
ncbi:hypothetical protein BAUCODRAFT_148856 [Baudoinia panamericana UAMH 10762]|uniref:Uncharacterized protein n=1 Tax=Baudoinia panamericana (strain UAMH 10762) TaxID=717646 RepID=M2MWW6_BAUPA|nr:uncharacterized protein BAUCODRAFT_148856 [Baudoinia panamericana UAMH 10762]EMC96018.1 hypothetical protein BAUCODRAFT_148856 [Baudoinia panamericana UAMH 10762]